MRSGKGCLHREPSKRDVAAVRAFNVVEQCIVMGHGNLRKNRCANHTANCPAGNSLRIVSSDCKVQFNGDLRYLSVSQVRTGANARQLSPSMRATCAVTEAADGGRSVRIAKPFRFHSAWLGPWVIQRERRGIRWIVWIVWRLSLRRLRISA